MEAFVSRYIIRHEFAFLRSLVEAALEIPEYGVGGFEQWCDVQERQRRIRDAKQVDVTRQDEIGIHASTFDAGETADYTKPSFGSDIEAKSTHQFFRTNPQSCARPVINTRGTCVGLQQAFSDDFELAVLEAERFEDRWRNSRARPIEGSRLKPATVVQTRRRLRLRFRRRHFAAHLFARPLCNQLPRRWIIVLA